MTVKECAKKKGIVLDHINEIKTYQSVDVNFINSEGIDDEVEFDVCQVLTKSGINELSILFSDFCKENNFKNNTVTCITIVKSADTEEKLQEE